MKSKGRPVLIVAVLLWWAVWVFFNHHGQLKNLEWFLEDFLWKARWNIVGEGPPSSVALVLINKESVKFLNGGQFRWPLDRSVLARVLEELAKSGVRAVGFDMLFNPDTKTPGDTQFAQAIASMPNTVVLGTNLEGKSYNANDDDDSEGYNFLTGVQPNAVAPEFLKDAWGRGSLNSLEKLEESKALRKIPLYFWVNKKPFPGLALGTWLAGNHLKTEDVHISSDSIRIASGQAICVEKVVPTADNFFSEQVVTPSFPRDWVARFGVENYPFLALVNPASAMNVQERRASLKDKFVLIGVGDDLLEDTIQLPNQAKPLPGVVFHASVLDSLARPEWFMQRFTNPDWKIFFDAVALLTAILILVIQSRLSALSGLAALVVVFGFITSGFIGLFCKGIILPWAVVPPTFLGTLMICYFVGFLFEEREKKVIRELFSKQVSAEIVEELLQKQDEIMVARRQEATVAFMDVCGFTTFSEKHSPERVLVQLNYYFNHFIPEIMRQHGTLDKIIGDALMILTGVPLANPDHAFQMLTIAININKKIAEMNKNLPHGFEPFTLSCGINSGDVIMGNLGSKERMEFTVIGDTVNLSARLQSYSKSQEIVVGPRTYELTKDRVQYADPVPITVKGKAEPILAYKVIGMIEPKA